MQRLASLSTDDNIIIPAGSKPFVPERLSEALGGKCVCGSAQPGEVMDLLDTLLEVESRALIEARRALAQNLNPEQPAGVRRWFDLADQISDRTRARLDLPVAGPLETAEVEP